MNDKKPFEIARETLKQLNARQLAPTPANYQVIYSEVAGVLTEPPFPADRLRDIARALPTKTPGQQKQRGLLDSAIGQLNWDGVKNALMAYGGFSPPATVPVAAGALASSAPLADTASPAVTAPALTADFIEQIARLIEYALPALGTDDARFTEQTQMLLKAMRQPNADVLAVKLMLGNFGNRLSFAAEDQAEIKVTLLKLLHLIIENIGELSLDDRWLKGQIDALLTASAPPLSLRRLDDVERRLKDVIFKQTEAKGRALEAQEDMRQMLATFIERLSQMSESTSTFHGKMEENARLIEQARTMADIAPVLKDVVGATRSMAHDSLTVRDELRGMREKAQTTEAELVKLHQELDRVSALARHDPLTGALNRKGLDEALDREVSNVRRKDTPMCMAMLDIDNFKKLNDTLGHVTGDAALTHLATVAREAMRPQDTLARYGGEEFVILLPDTPLDKGVEAMTRLQREMTKHFFLAGSEKILITFSAGVAQLAANESGLDAIKRADQAMYLAKRAGKNRVLGA
ncbi:MAG: diguanylate cyclase [Rhodoferax sp.]|nr:diguanylate cyclase [Rhodoferax sp.]